MLQGKKIILGITGSIAAYKAALLTRLLIKEGADVQVLMTEAATQFIPALTLSTLSKHPVYTQLSDHEVWNNHVILGKSADLFIIAPASANTIAQMSSGLCPNMLLATYLSSTCPVFLAPAMDLDMWEHPSTRQNLKTLADRGVHIIDAEEGELASGLTGAGRMAEPEHILEKIKSFLSQNQKLTGKKALVTAGPTYEALDPVRYIGNHSSGKMGIAVAEALAGQGAEVTLVLGPGDQAIRSGNINVRRVTTALEMKEICDAVFPEADIAVLAAAVADYRPAETATQKIKKSADEFLVRLVRNPDILKGLGTIKTPAQVLAGFAMETEHLEENALKKLREKHLDLIVLNSLREKGAGFRTDTNKGMLFKANGEKIPLPLMSKKDFAKEIVSHLIALYEEKN